MSPDLRKFMLDGRIGFPAGGDIGGVDFEFSVWGGGSGHEKMSGARFGTNHYTYRGPGLARKLGLAPENPWPNGQLPLFVCVLFRLVVFPRRIEGTSRARANRSRVNALIEDRKIK